jgi:hypothetical protein
MDRVRARFHLRVVGVGWRATGWTEVNFPSLSILRMEVGSGIAWMASFARFPQVSAASLGSSVGFRRFGADALASFERSWPLFTHAIDWLCTFIREIKRGLSGPAYTGR